jgi:hypothetical protein
VTSDPVRITARITSAGQSATEEREARMRRYVVTQLVRVVCLVVAVVLPAPLPVRLAFIPAALLLPYLGVVAANAGPSRERGTESALVERTAPVRLQLDPARTVEQD